MLDFAHFFGRSTRPRRHGSWTVRHWSTAAVHAIASRLSQSCLPDSPNDHSLVPAQASNGTHIERDDVEWERNCHLKGHIDIERLMAHVESLMPYDYAGFASNAATSTHCFCPS